MTLYPVSHRMDFSKRPWASNLLRLRCSVLAVLVRMLGWLLVYRRIGHFRDESRIQVTIDREK
jgi:hypothetical protein